MKKIPFWRSYGEKYYLGPEDPIYGYMGLWSEARKYEVIKTRM